MHRPGSEDPHWHERKFAYSNSIPQKIRLWPPSADFNEYIFVNGTICLKEDNLNLFEGRQPQYSWEWKTTIPSLCIYFPEIFIVYIYSR